MFRCIPHVTAVENAQFKGVRKFFRPLRPLRPDVCEIVICAESVWYFSSAPLETDDSDKCEDVQI